MPAKKYEENCIFPEFKKNREKTSFLNALRNLDFPIFLHKCKINKKNIHRLLRIARSNTRAKFQGKVVKAPESSWLLENNTFLPKITHQYFLVQNQYNQTIIKFLLKSYFQDHTHIP